MADSERHKLTPEEIEEIRSRSDRFFVDDHSGRLLRFRYRDGSNDRFDAASGAWVPDPSEEAFEFMMRGGYLTEVTADEAASIVSGDDDGLSLLARTQPRRPYL